MSASESQSRELKDIHTSAKNSIGTQDPHRYWLPISPQVDIWTQPCPCKAQSWQGPYYPLHSHAHEGDPHTQQQCWAACPAWSCRNDCTRALVRTPSMIGPSRLKHYLRGLTVREYCCATSKWRDQILCSECPPTHEVIICQCVPNVSNVIFAGESATAVWWLSVN